MVQNVILRSCPETNIPSQSFSGLTRESSGQYGLMFNWMPDQVGHDMGKAGYLS